MTAKPIKNLKITDEDYTEEVEKGSIDVRFGKIAPDLKYTCILDMRYNVYGENEGKYPISEEITLSLKVPLKTSKKSGRILGSLINN